MSSPDESKRKKPNGTVLIVLGGLVTLFAVFRLLTTLPTGRGTAHNVGSFVDVGISFFGGIICLIVGLVQKAKYAEDDSER